MAFGRKKKETEPEPAIEEVQVIEPDEPEKEWPDLSNTPNNQQGGEPNMALDTTEDGRSSNGGDAVIQGRTRVAVTDHWVDAATAAAFEEVRAKIGPGTSIRTITDYFFGHPARIHENLPEPPPIESYTAKEIGAKVKAKLLENL